MARDKPSNEAGESSPKMSDLYENSIVLRQCFKAAGP
jgi:hypothetical protein